jgi:hypothetical protein
LRAGQALLGPSKSKLAPLPPFTLAAVHRTEKTLKRRQSKGMAL